MGVEKKLVTPSVHFAGRVFFHVIPSYDMGARLVITNRAMAMSDPGRDP